MAYSPRTPPRCREHKDELSGWYCDACKRPLCGQCTAAELERFFCCHCEGVARQLSVARTDIGFLGIVFAALLYPLRKRIGTLLALALALAALTVCTAAYLEPAAGEAVTEHAPMILMAKGALRGVLLWVVLILVVGMRAHAEGKNRGAANRVLQGCLATLIAWLPGIAYLIFVRQGLPDAAMLKDWVVLLYAGLCVVYVPIALAVTSGGVSFLQVLNPFMISECAWRVRSRYLLTLVGLAVLGGLAIQVETRVADAVRAAIQAPFVPDLAVETMTVGLMLMAACLIGSLSFVYGYEFGWGTADDFRDPLLPDLRADGTLKRWAERIAALNKPIVSSEEREKKVPLAQGEGVKVREIAECIKGDSMTRALKLYEARPSWTPGAFNPRQVLALGTAAMVARKPVLAQKILEELAVRDEPTAGRALLVLAQVHETKDAARARELLEQVITRFPGTDAAKLAEKRLAGAGAGSATGARTDEPA